MALFMRILKSSESIVLKNCPLTFKTNWNVECAFSVKKVDIPAPPKRPLSAYMIFCKENRQNILKEDPTLTSPEQIKRLAAKWSTLNNDMKKPYEVSAREGILVYGEAHKKFYENLTEHQKDELERLKEKKKEMRRKLKLNRDLKNHGLPKPASSAYALFVKSESKKMKGDVHKATEDNVPKTKWRLSQITDLIQSPMDLLGLSSDVVPKRISPTEFLKEVADRWNKLSPEAKAKYTKESEAEKKRFESEMGTWKEMMRGEGNIKLLKQFEEISSRKSKKKSLLEES